MVFNLVFDSGGVVLEWSLRFNMKVVVGGGQCDSGEGGGNGGG